MEIGNPDHRKVNDLIKHVRIAFLTTVAADGSLHARPMATQQAAFDGILLFVTRMDSAKVSEARSDTRACVTYADPSSNTYVALTGSAQTLRDPIAVSALWNPFVQAWFPKGPKDPNVGILRIAVDQAEYWDGPASRFVQLYQLARANLTGQAPAMGEHGVVQMGG
jgi:general stress protein 26